MPHTDQLIPPLSIRAFLQFLFRILDENKHLLYNYKTIFIHICTLLSFNIYIYMKREEKKRIV